MERQIRNYSCKYVAYKDKKELTADILNTESRYKNKLITESCSIYVKFLTVSIIRQSGESHLCLFLQERHDVPHSRIHKQLVQLPFHFQGV